MKPSQLLAASWAFLLSGIVCLAQVSPLHVPILITTAPAQGLGDVVASSKRFCWSLRACSIATAGSKAINVCNALDAACVDMVTNLTTGSLMVTTVGGTDCSMATCTIKTIYEKFGSVCGGGNCDQTQATIAKRPVLTFNSSPKGHPCATFVSSSAQLLETAGTAPVVAQQISTSAFAKNASTSTVTIIFAGNGNLAPLVFYNGSNTAKIYAGTSASVTAADGSFHRFQSVLSGTNSLIDIDGSITNSLNANTNPLPAQRMFIGSDNFADLTDGVFCEFALWGIYSLTGTDLTNLNANQSNYW